MKKISEPQCKGRTVRTSINITRNPAGCIVTAFAGFFILYECQRPDYSRNFPGLDKNLEIKHIIRFLPEDSVISPETMVFQPFFLLEEKHLSVIISLTEDIRRNRGYP